MGLGTLEPLSARNTMSRDTNLAESVLSAAVTSTALRWTYCSLSPAAQCKLSAELYAPLPLRKFAVLRGAVDAGQPAPPRPRITLLARPPPLREQPPKRLRRA